MSWELTVDNTTSHIDRDTATSETIDHESISFDQDDDSINIIAILTTYINR